MKTSHPALILLVEDDPHVRAVTAETLALAGYRVLEAQDGIEALDILARETPDLIVSDVRMPRCDGFELLQRVRRNPTLAVVPFLVVSAKSETADRRMGMSLGADDYINKPYLPDDLLRAVAFRLERAAMLTELQESHQWFLARVLPHELRTPLCGILGCGDLLLQSGEAGQSVAPSDAIEYGTMINRCGERLLRVAEDLTLWAMLEGKLQAARDTGVRAPNTPVVIQPSVFGQALAKWAGSYARTGDLTVKIEPAVLAVPVDDEAVLGAIRHLLDNALKFSLPGQPVCVSGSVRGARYVVEVEDQGRGLAETQLANLGALRQAGRRSFEHDGIGVGLTIIRALARLVDGSFTLHAAIPPGRGVTAHLELPLAPAGLSPQSPASAPGATG